jgi:hypothetical protein
MQPKPNDASRFFVSLPFATALVFLLTSFGLSRADEGTPAQRRACKPEVFRLCKEFIPNRTAITACLQRHRAQLNPDCRAVFSGAPK